MDFIPPHLHQQPRRELSAHEHNQATYTAIMAMLVILFLLLLVVAEILITRPIIHNANVRVIRIAHDLNPAILQTFQRPLNHRRAGPIIALNLQPVLMLAGCPVAAVGFKVGDGLPDGVFDYRCQILRISPEYTNLAHAIPILFSTLNFLIIWIAKKRLPHTILAGVQAAIDEAGSTKHAVCFNGKWFWRWLQPNIMIMVAAHFPTP